MKPSTIRTNIWKISSVIRSEANDALAVEEPLEIRLLFGPVTNKEKKSISVTMRTPGNDAELALGFLFTEGIISGMDQVESIQPLQTIFQNQLIENIILVALPPSTKVDLSKLERHFYTSSSCGVCGKTSIEAVQHNLPPMLPQQKPQFSSKIIHLLPKRLKHAQTVFRSTGGLHAAAFFDTYGNLKLLREDIGRHNAMDKLIGASIRNGYPSLEEGIVLVSGRASFELVQKALMAGIPAMAAVGAPSSLAVELARENGMALLGFVRDDRFNIYSEPEMVL